MTIWMDKPWDPLSSDAVDALPAQLGVYEVANADGIVLAIQYAGGRELFGLRSALGRELDAGASLFRYEITHAYLTRWQELLMAHRSRVGSLPTRNESELPRLGTLSP